MSKKNNRKKNRYSSENRIEKEIDIVSEVASEVVMETTAEIAAETEAVENAQTEVAAEVENVTESGVEVITDAVESEMEDTAKVAENEVEAEAVESEAEAVEAETVENAEAEAVEDETVENAKAEAVEAETVENAEAEAVEVETVENTEAVAVEAETESKVVDDTDAAQNAKLEEAKLAREAAAMATKNRKERNEEIAKAKENDAKREVRRKRRIRNQIIAYFSVFLFIVIIGVGGFLIVNRIVSLVGKGQIAQAPVEIPEETEDKINDLIGQEQEIKEPETLPEQIVEEPVVEPEPEDPLGDYIDTIIASMTLEQKVAGLFLTSPEALTGVDLATVAGAGTQAALDQYAVGGMLYKDKNISNQEQFGKMVSGTVQMVGVRPAFFAFAEEGGDKASAIAKAGFYEAVPSAADLVADGDVSKAHEAGVTIGTALKEMGFNLVLAPVTDPASAGSVLGNRAYSESAIISSEYVKSMMNGLSESGVTPCLKYFPGYGGVTTNPATGRAVSSKDEAEFRSNELLIYQAAIQSGVPMIMVSDVVIEAFDDSCPATLSSSIVTDILRDELEYDGVVLSANLSDAAVSEYYEPGEASILALKAGCDMIQNPEDFPAAYAAVIDATNSGVIAEERINDSLKRIYRILYADSI